MTDDTPRRLRWGQSLARDASRAGCENTIPVFDDDAHIGDIELSDDDTRVLTAMLADLVVSLAPAYRNPVKRVRFDLLDDDKLDHLYDRLEVAEQFLAAFVVRGNPETWQRQADEIGRLLGQVDDRDQAITRVRGLHSPVTVYASADRCGCHKQGHDYHNTEETERGDDVCINTPIGEVCDICRVPDGCEADSIDGDHVNWPCPTAAAIDGDTPKETT